MEDLISESHHNVTYDDTHYLGKIYLDKVTGQFKVHNNDPLFKDLQDESLDENVKKRWNVLHFLVRQQNLLKEPSLIEKLVKYLSLHQKYEWIKTLGYVLLWNCYHTITFNPSLTLIDIQFVCSIWYTIKEDSVFISCCKKIIKRVLGLISSLNTDYIKRRLSNFVMSVFNNFTYLLGEHFWLDVSLWNGTNVIWDIFLLLPSSDRIEGFLYHFIHKLLEHERCREIIITSLYLWSKQYKRITQLYYQQQILELDITVWSTFRTAYSALYFITRCLLISRNKKEFNDNNILLSLLFEIDHDWEYNQKEYKKHKGTISTFENDKKSRCVYQSKLFYIIHHLLDYCFYSHVSWIQQISKHIIKEQERVSDLESKILELEANERITIHPTRHRLRRLELMTAKRNVTELVTRQRFIKKYLNLIDTNGLFHQLVLDTSRMCLRYIGIGVSSCIPEFIWKHQSSYLHDFIGYCIDSTKIDSILYVGSELIGRYNIISNYHQRIEFLDYMYEIVHYDNFKSIPEGLGNFHHNYHILSYIINFSLEIEKMDVDNFYHQYQCCIIVQNLLNLNTKYQRYLQRDILCRERVYTRYIHLLITMMTDISNDMFQKYRKYLFPNNFLNSNKKILHNLVLYYVSYLLVLQSLVKYCHLEDSYKSIITAGNYFISCIFQYGVSIDNNLPYFENQTDIPVDKRINVEFKIDTRYTLLAVVDIWSKIYSSLYNCVEKESLLQSIVTDSNYNLDVYSRLISYAENNNTLTKKSFWTVVVSLFQECIQFSNTYIDYDQFDPPYELCDPLMQTCINEPVKNPVNNLMMEKDILYRHLLTNNFDPFTRQTLTMNMIEKHNQIPCVMKEIRVFKTKITEWKKNVHISPS